MEYGGHARNPGEKRLLMSNENSLGKDGEMPVLLRPMKNAVRTY